jgi:hypothetical protein
MIIFEYSTHRKSTISEFFKHQTKLKNPDFELAETKATKPFKKTLHEH